MHAPQMAKKTKGWNDDVMSFPLEFLSLTKKHEVELNNTMSMAVTGS